METLDAGTHSLRVSQMMPLNTTQIRQLCSIEMQEYRDATEYHKEPGYVGAFPTIDWTGKKTYRPTHDSCLMRNMERTSFCPVCQEGMWLNLLERISLIDAFEQDCKDFPILKVTPLPLGQFRTGNDQIKGEWITVSWKNKTQEWVQFANQTSITLPKSAIGESWTVTVTFQSPEIRKKSELLESTKSFRICSM
jgi:hypothetical protein